MKTINIGIREMGELYALRFLIETCLNHDLQWNVFIVPFNSDLKLFDTKSFLFRYKNVKLFSGIDLFQGEIIGFISSISDRVNDRIIPKIDLCTVIVCMYYDTYDQKSLITYDIVVSNVKINDKDPKKEYDPEMWKQLGTLPYSVAVIPRHPFPENYLQNIEIPKNIHIVNQIGMLKGLCAKARLVIMGLIFSSPDNESDHNPLEATVNSNAICGIYENEELIYKDLYENSGLLHKYKRFSDSLPDIERLINDSHLNEKLKYRGDFLLRNKKIYMEKILIELLY